MTKKLERSIFSVISTVICLKLAWTAMNAVVNEQYLLTVICFIWLAGFAYIEQINHRYDASRNVDQMA